MKKKMNRWYDAYQKLPGALESLKGRKPAHRDRIIAHVIELIHDNAPGLLEKYLLDFPLDQKRRRWYDQDPYLWLMVNGLQYAAPGLLKKVTKYLENAARAKKS